MMMIKLAFMMMAAFSVIMIGVSLSYLDGQIQGAFVGLWFCVAMFSGWQYLRQGKMPTDSETVQREYQKTLDGLSYSSGKRPVRKRRVK